MLIGLVSLIARRNLALLRKDGTGHCGNNQISLA
jgi:hypothetical protein